LNVSLAGSVGAGRYGELRRLRRSALPAAYTKALTPSSKAERLDFSARCCQGKFKSPGECSSSTREPLVTYFSFCGGGLTWYCTVYSSWSAGKSVSSYFGKSLGTNSAATHLVNDSLPASAWVKIMPPASANCRSFWRSRSLSFGGT